MRTGGTIGDYRILEELGRGGEGRVFKVEHVITRRKEAMKVLSGAGLLEQELAQRFMREIRVQASLDHPHIAAVHNAFWHGNELVMVMELVDGAPLAELVQRGPLDMRKAVEIGCQVLSALEHAHERGVVHRDVSPANIIIGPDDQVKLTDFGLAWTAADMRMTKSGTFMGSVHYMSPEQVRGAEKADTRSDIYSCSAVLYEAVTGCKPFYSENAFQVMRAHVEEAPVAPSQKNAAVPYRLEQAILKALAKDPRERFVSAGEFLHELRMLLESPVAAAELPRLAPVAARVPARSEMRWLGPSWLLGLAAGVLLVAVTSFGGFHVNWAVPAVPEPIPTPAAAPSAVEAVAPESPKVEPEPVAPRPVRTSIPKPPKPAPAEPKPFPVVRIYNSEAPPAAPAAPAAAPPTAEFADGPAPVFPPPPVAGEAAPVTADTPAPVALADANAAKPEEKPKAINRFLGRVKSLNPFRRRGTAESERELPAPAH